MNNTSIATTVMDEWNDTLRGFTSGWLDVKQTMDSFAKDMAGSGSVALGSLAALIDDLGYEAIENAITGIENFTGRVAGKDMEFPRLREWVDILSQYGIDLNMVRDYIGKVLGKMGFTGWIEKFGQSLKSIDAGKILDKISKIFNPGDGLMKIGGTLGSWFSAMDFSALNPAQWFDKLFSGSLLPEGFLSRIPDFMKGAWDGIKNAAGKISDFISPYMDDLQQILGLDVPETVSGIIRKTKESLGDFFSAIMPALDDLSVSSLKEYIRGFKGNFKESLSGLGTSLGKYGKDIWKDFTGGLGWKDVSNRSWDVLKGYINPDSGFIAGSIKNSGSIFGDGGMVERFKDMLANIPSGGESGGHFPALALAGAGLPPSDAPGALTHTPGNSLFAPQATGANQQQKTVSMNKFCDTIEIHIDSANDKGYDQIGSEITELFTQIFDDYGN